MTPLCTLFIRLITFIIEDIIDAACAFLGAYIGC